MFATHRDSIGHFTQLQLSTFERHSRESFYDMLDNGKINPQQSRILKRLQEGSAIGSEFGILQYGARIYELRRMGFCIKNFKEEGTKKRFILSIDGHQFDPFKGECSVCGTPKGEE